jgi:hypothetical protein
MAKLIKIEANRTYASEANAVKAFEKVYGECDSLRYFIMKTEEGRYFPIAIGQAAAQEGVHFNFNVIG